MVLPCSFVYGTYFTCLFLEPHRGRARYPGRRTWHEWTDAEEKNGVTTSRWSNSNLHVRCPQPDVLSVPPRWIAHLSRGFSRVTDDVLVRYRTCTRTKPRLFDSQLRVNVKA
ncbi:hypothetical protein F4802DRAFT_530551 [Xylaria palmicola]|nr:hypothetical protein F4802DRAFT_530551 [Xylaria palmicola]